MVSYLNMIRFTYWNDLWMKYVVKESSFQRCNSFTFFAFYRVPAYTVPDWRLRVNWIYSTLLLNIEELDGGFLNRRQSGRSRLWEWRASAWATINIRNQETYLRTVLEVILVQEAVSYWFCKQLFLLDVYVSFVRVGWVLDCGVFIFLAG